MELFPIQEEKEDGKDDEETSVEKPCGRIALYCGSADLDFNGALPFADTDGPIEEGCVLVWDERLDMTCAAEIVALLDRRSGF
jgi:hypothetical protein